MIDYRQPENGLLLARRIARSAAVHSMREFQGDELEGVATDALMEALGKDTGVGNFQAFLNRIVRARIVDYKRKHGPFTRGGRVRSVPRPRKVRRRKLNPEEYKLRMSQVFKNTWATKREKMLSGMRRRWALRTPEERREIVQKIQASGATRTEEFRLRMRNVWALRTPEERRMIVWKMQATRKVNNETSNSRASAGAAA